MSIGNGLSFVSADYSQCFSKEQHLLFRAYQKRNKYRSFAVWNSLLLLLNYLLALIGGPTFLGFFDIEHIKDYT